MVCFFRVGVSEEEVTRNLLTSLSLFEKTLADADAPPATSPFQPLFFLFLFKKFLYRRAYMITKKNIHLIHTIYVNCNVFDFVSSVFNSLNFCWILVKLCMNNFTTSKQIEVCFFMVDCQLSVNPTPKNYTMLVDNFDFNLDPKTFNFGRDNVILKGQ